MQTQLTSLANGSRNFTNMILTSELSMQQLTALKTRCLAFVGRRHDLVSANKVRQIPSSSLPNAER
jgi:hypothetical protein